MSGVLSSPNFPNNYDAGEYCLWEISAPQGYRIQAEVRWFGVEDHRYSRPGRCEDDYLVITEYLGNTSDDNIVARLCGCKETYTYISPKEKMWFSFTSYKKANWPGFYVSYQVLGEYTLAVSYYSATTRTGAFERRLSNHNVVLKAKDSQVLFFGISATYT